MTLKDEMALDLDEVFFNPDELAEEIDWNGAAILAVPSGRTSETEGEQENADEHGVLAQRRTLVIRDQDLDPMPVIWEEILLNGEPWYVEGIEPREGAQKITLMRDRS